MIDATVHERAAMAAALHPLGEFVSEVGLEKPLAEYTRDQILTLVEIVIDAFQAYLVETQARQDAQSSEHFESQLARSQRTHQPSTGAPLRC